MSKKFYFVIIFLLPVLAYSQVQKGDNFGTADGSFYYNHSASSYNNTLESKGDELQYSLNWNMLHFVSKRIAIGPGFGFAFSNGIMHFYDQSNDPYSKETTSSVSVGLSPLFRYYFCDSTKINWFIGVEGTCSYSWNTYKYSGPSNWGTNEINPLIWGGALSLGTVYFITRNVGFETILKYMITETEYYGKYASGIPKNLDQSVGISMGMMIYLGKPAK